MTQIDDATYAQAELLAEFYHTPEKARAIAEAQLRDGSPGLAASLYVLAARIGDDPEGDLARANVILDVAFPTSRGL